MIAAMWITLSVIVYFAGFIGTAAYEERHCRYRSVGHKFDGWERTECGHPWDTPIPVAWPLALALLIVIAPFWLTFGGAGKLSHKLAELPTRDEKRERREKKRDEERTQLKATIKRLETELEMKHSD